MKEFNQTNEGSKEYCSKILHQNRESLSQWPRRQRRHTILSIIKAIAKGF